MDIITKSKIKVKLIAVLLAVGVLFTSFYYGRDMIHAVEKVDYNLRILTDNKPVSSILLEKTEKKTLSASGLPDGAEYQWQIFIVSDNLWVNISDKQSETCELSAALVEGVGNNSEISLRVKATLSGEEYVSSPLSVAMDISSEVSAFDGENIETNYTSDYNNTNKAVAYTRSMEAYTKVNAQANVETPDVVSITIHYTLNGETIFNDYIASLRYGSSFSASVPSPTHMGYAPYILVDGEEQSAENVNLSYHNLDRSYELTVYYKPALSQYSVCYFLQNLSNDLYTEATELSFEGKALTGSFPIDDIEKEIYGFSPLYHVSDVVAADNSTVFYIYYDRNYYLYSFECDGGYGAGPIYARYGTRLVISNPVKPGYTFVGWDLQDEYGNYDGIADGVPSYMGVGNKSYKAIWKSADTTVTIIYWNENPDDDGYNYWDSRVISATSGTKITYNDIIDPCVMHDSDVVQSVTLESGETASSYPLTNAYDADFASYWLASNDSSDPTIKIDVQSQADWQGATNIYVNLGGAYADGGVGKMVTVTMTVHYTDGTSKVIQKEVEMCDDFSYSVDNGGDIDYITLDFSNRKVLDANENWTTDGASFQYGVAEIELYAHSSMPIPTRPDGNVVSESEFFHYSMNEELTQETNGEEITVAGDGSTVIQIYYKRNNYTLRFYYAFKTSDGIVKAIGGSTQQFSKGEQNNKYKGTDVALLLDNISTGEWGRFENLPELKDEAKAIYTTGYEVLSGGQYTGYTAYYIEFTAKYGTLITDKWPISAFNPVKSIDGQFGEYALFSAWNGEHHIKYSQTHNIAAYNYNVTVKGLYYRLDDELLYETQYNNEYLTDDKGNKMVRYLAFWENGAKRSWNQARKWTYNLWFEVLADNSELYNMLPSLNKTAINDITLSDGSTIKLRYKTDKWYYLYNSSIACDNNTTIANQTATAVKGYTNISKKNTASTDILSEDEAIYYGPNGTAHIADFYYDRNVYNLRIYNSGKYITYEYDGTEQDYIGVIYETNLYSVVNDKFSSLTPPYPDNLEPGAYEFAGWYTSPTYSEGTEVTEASKMLATDMTIYAKWTIKSHTVTFSNSYTAMSKGEYINNEQYAVERNAYISPESIPTANPSEFNLEETPEFIGWFYMDDTDTKRAFDPYEMVISQDFHLFAEWQSSEIRAYTVNYYLLEDDGTPTTTKIADSTTGYAYVGLTRTFSAKASNERYSEYSIGYYPKVSSSSVLISEDANENVVNFYYIYKEQVNYTVYYIDSVTKKELLPSKNVTTSADIITEKYQYIEGYISDAFYKYLTLTSDDSKNVITFYYTQDALHVRYIVKHLIENLDDTNYSEYSTIDEIGEIGSTIHAQAMAITGFTYEKTVIEQGDVTEELNNPLVERELSIDDGLVITFYYKRNASKITVKFVEYGNLEYSLKESEIINGKFGQKIRHDSSPESIEKNSTTYHRIGEGIYNITLNDNDEQVLYIYYQAQVVTISYIPVCLYQSDNYGEVSLTCETVSNTNGITGSTPTALGEDFKFAGWFKDPNCTEQVSSEMYDEEAYQSNNTLKLNSMPQNNVTYYALFECKKSSIKITKTGIDAENQNQTFLFSVQALDNKYQTVNLTVAVTGNSSVTLSKLPIGDYEITEITAWAWQYGIDGDSSQTVTLSTDGGCEEITFTNRRNDSVWLGGEVSKDNIFTAKPTT